MKVESMIESVDCKTAEEFMDEMSSDRGRLWKRTRESIFDEEDWVFRGVPRVSYTLTPSAFRKNAFVPFMTAQIDFVVDSAK